MKRGRDSWILAFLLLVFVTVTVFFGSRDYQRQRNTMPSTYNVDTEGLKALYQLYQKQGYTVERFEQPLAKLPQTGALLVMHEPFERALSPGEEDALTRWIEEGGSLLLITSGANDARNIPFHVAVAINVVTAKPMPADLDPSENEPNLTRDVHKVHVSGSSRLVYRGRQNESSTLVGDSLGAYAITYYYDRGGTVVVATDGITPNNASLANADNAVFFVDIASYSLRANRKLILFDEYHQGFGSEEHPGRSLWEALGEPVRVAFFYVLTGFFLLVYSLNWRFGAPVKLAPPALLTTTEYISSMARIYQRAGATDLAMEAIYGSFVRNLTFRLGVPTETPSPRIAELASKKYGWNEHDAEVLFRRCETILNGEKVTEAEMQKLAIQIDGYRRSVESD